MLIYLNLYFYYYLKKKRVNIMKRRVSREIAFKLVFESFFVDFRKKEEIENFSEKQNVKLSEYSKKLVIGVIEKREDLDKKINLYLKNWEFERISKIIISILEIAFYEIIYVKDVDFPIAINEAVELAKKFFGNEGPSFVNGVLGSFVKDLKNLN